MKIILADINSSILHGKRTGHYYALARNYKDLFGDDCVIAGGPIYRDGFPEKDLMILPYNVKSGESSIKTRLKNFANARALFKKAEGQCIVLQQCATITTFLCIWLFYHRKSKLYFIQYSLEGFRMRLGNIFYSLAKKKIDGLICPNEMVGRAYDIPYCVVPDYIYAKEKFETKQTKSYYDKIYDFCILGRIAPGKGCIESAIRLAGKKCKVVIAGNPSNKDLENELKNACIDAPNIDLRLGYISDEEYAALTSQSRYSLLNYQGEYSKRSSGVVLDMVFSGTPVVGCRCTALEFIEKHELGHLYNDIDTFDVESVLNENIYNAYMQNIEKYCALHGEYREKLRKFILE